MNDSVSRKVNEINWVDLRAGDLYLGFGGYLLVLRVGLKTLRDGRRETRLYEVEYFFDEGVHSDSIALVTDSRPVFMRGIRVQGIEVVV